MGTLPLTPLGVRAALELAGLEPIIGMPGAFRLVVEQLPYEDFVLAKAKTAEVDGFEIDDAEIHAALSKPHQRIAVQWAARGGRRALFEAFGLGKTRQQLELVRLILKKLVEAGKTKHGIQEAASNRLRGGHGLIIAPLGVRLEFAEEAAVLGIHLRFVRTTAECAEPGIYITNYESVREGKIDPAYFDVASLDEAAVLRSFGSKTFGEFLFGGGFEKVKYRFVATATPDPNDYLELIAYAHFLGVMDMGEAKTRFFKRDSEKADKLTLHAHKEEEFWLWVASWAFFLQTPSDLGFDDEGYKLPPFTVEYHEVAADEIAAGPPSIQRNGQMRMIRNSSFGVSEASREKKLTLQLRVDKMREILEARPGQHAILWHDLEAERTAIEKALCAHYATKRAVSLYGNQALDVQESALHRFAHGEVQYLAAKPVMAGSGGNYQKHCHMAIFVGVGFKFNDFFQAIHRIYRFLQTEPVEIHIIHASTERSVVEKLKAKWDRHNAKVARMQEIVKEYGLSNLALQTAMKRGFGVVRQEAKSEPFSANGENGLPAWTLINNDSVLEMRSMPENSVGLILTSIPFSGQYEYSPNYMDFGHTDDAAHFWQQMDYLTPEMLRVLEPGRVAAIHVKDRVVPGALMGVRFQTVQPFHADCIAHFMRHGFFYMGVKTIVTDVVRENNQTYRAEEQQVLGHPNAHGGGVGTLAGPSQALAAANYKTIFRMFRQRSLSEIYDFEEHVRLGDRLHKYSVDRGHCRCAAEGKRASCSHGRLPTDFMLLQPQSWSDDVWADIVRMRTLNSTQAQKGRMKHLCPLQFDITDRVINQFSMPGELVADPFSGIGTVPYRAVLLGRRGWGCELNTDYWSDSITYSAAAEAKLATPTLFSMVAAEDEEEIEVQAA